MSVLDVPVKKYLLVISPELEIEFWDIDYYYKDYENPSLPVVVPVTQIHCQLARGRITNIEPQMWVTTTMFRVSGSLVDIFLFLIVFKYLPLPAE